MKHIVLAVAICLPGCGGPAQVVRDTSPQEQLVTTCNYEADVRQVQQGPERSRFVSTCLAQGRVRMQEVLKDCNALARTRTGRQREEFMRQCVRQ
jgi:hypothetical protein